MAQGTRTAMFSRHQPGGVFSYFDITEHPAGVWFVCSATTGAANSVGAGQNPDTPFATLVYAETQAESDDVIYVMPGHAETLTGSPSLTLDVAGLKVIGIGTATRRPTFLIDAADTAHVLLSGADTWIENLVFSAGHADIAKAIDIKAVGVTVRGCMFIANAVDENFLIAINIATADDDSDGATIEGNRIYQLDAASTHGIWVVKNCANLTIRGNILNGEYVADSAPIGADSAEICLNVLIDGNIINNVAADGIHAIEFAAANTGCMVRNLSGDVDGDGTPFIGTGLSLCENFHTGAVTKSGFVYPARDT